jgi:hypothetical protein
MFVRKRSKNIRFDALKWQAKSFLQKGFLGIKIIGKRQGATYYLTEYPWDEIKELKRWALVLNSKLKKLKRFFLTEL